MKEAEGGKHFFPPRFHLGFVFSRWTSKAIEWSLGKFDFWRNLALELSGGKIEYSIFLFRFFFSLNGSIAKYKRVPSSVLAT